MTSLSAQEAAAAWDTLGADHTAPGVTPAPPRTYKHYRPFVDAANDFITEAQDDQRIYTGTAEFDEQMRGIGRGHLCIVTGYSHSGKTQWVTSVMRRNRDKRTLLFIPDEPAPLVLSKLASIESGMPARQLESLVAQNDPAAIDLLRNTALVDFPNLIVMDRPLSARVMDEGWDEATDVWGAEPELVIMDYVDLLQVDGDLAQAKFDFIKGYGSRHQVPIIAIHQTSRSAGADGKKMTISSGNYGGEQHATFMVGVRRKISAIGAELEEQRKKAANGSETAAARVTELEWELGVHKYTLTISLVKNKRPGGGLVDDLDIEIDVDTGQLFPLHPEELPSQYTMEVSQRKNQAPAAPAAGFTDEEMF